ncbi:MAG TPA: hypothetical protein VLA97_07675, partial [Nocardioidaceae bacterium]|nr:hypothetical protein [Nocardioidaceae bacterium]
MTSIPPTVAASVASVASVVRLLETLTTIDSGASFPGAVLPRLAEVIECDELTYSEVGPAGATRRLDHAVHERREPVTGRHRLTLTMALPGRCLAGITLRRTARGFTTVERQLLEVLRGPLLAGLARAHADGPATPSPVP